MSLPIKLLGSRLYKSLQGLFFMFVHAKKNMMKVVEKIIHKKREQNQNNGIHAARDVIDVLINNATDRVTKRLTDELISNNMIDLMIPGEDYVLFLLCLQSNTLVIALSLSNMWRFSVIANGIAAGYSFIQGRCCVWSIVKGSVLFNKGLALLIFSCDQVAAAAQSAVVGKFGQLELQWMKICDMYRKFSNSFG